jgi:hypothetical protein
MQLRSNSLGSPSMEYGTPQAFHHIHSYRNNSMSHVPPCVISRDKFDSGSQDFLTQGYTEMNV